MAEKSTAIGYLNWVLVTVFFMAMGIVSKALVVSFAGVQSELVDKAAAPIAVASAVVVAIMGWRGSTDEYAAWEGFLIAVIPFIIAVGYIPSVEAQLSSIQFAMVVYNWISWLLSTTIIWILSRDY